MTIILIDGYILKKNRQSKIVTAINDTQTVVIDQEIKNSNTYKKKKLLKDGKIKLYYSNSFYTSIYIGRCPTNDIDSIRTNKTLTHFQLKRRYHIKAIKSD